MQDLFTLSISPILLANLKSLRLTKAVLTATGVAIAAPAAIIAGKARAKKPRVIADPAPAVIASLWLSSLSSLNASKSDFCGYL